VDAPLQLSRRGNDSNAVNVAAASAF